MKKELMANHTGFLALQDPNLREVMGLTRWILALCGSVRLEVCGAHPERVLNACADAGIACTASEPVDAYTLRFTVRITLLIA